MSQWRCQKVILSPLLCNLEVNFSGCSSLALWKSRQRSASSPSPNYHHHYHHHHHHYHHRSSCSSRIFVRCLHLFVRTRLSPGYPQISACQHINTLSHYTTTLPYRTFIHFAFRTVLLKRIILTSEPEEDIIASSSSSSPLENCHHYHHHHHQYHHHHLKTTVHRSRRISSASMTSLRRLRGSSSPPYPGPQRSTRARSLPDIFTS